MSGDLILITSLIGDTFNKAATRGNNDFPKDDDPAIIWVDFNSFWVAMIRGVNTSGSNPLKSAPSAVSTFDTPFTFDACSAT